MSAGRSAGRPRLALVLWLISMVLFMGGASLYIPNELANDGVFSPQLFLVPGFATVGAVVAARTANRIGWLYLTLGLVAAITLFAGQLDERLELTGWDVQGVRPIAAWLGNWTWPLNYLLLGMSLLLFPDGALPSKRWRWVGWAFCLSWGLLVLGTVFQSEQLVLGEGPAVKNPFAVPGVTEALEMIAPWIMPIAVASLAGAALAPIIRYRRAGLAERQQIKWLAYTLAAVIALVAIAGLLTLLSESAGAVVMFASVGLVTMGIPVAVGVAILRYRLYDIDVIVNRALVYVLLSVGLATAYLGSVVVLQRLLSPVTADSDIAVAGSTLAVAALFRPMRSRMQSFIDHRFFRRKYDAAHTLEMFAARLRDEVDLASLGRQLVEVVEETMQPAHASVWLRSEGQVRT